MKKKISKWLSILLPLLLGVILIVYQYHQFTADQLVEMKGYFRNANYLYIYLSLFIATFGFASRAYRWKFSLEHMGYTSKLSNNIMAVCIGYFMNLTIPRSGEISRAVIVKKYEDVPFDKAFGTIVAERIVDLMLFFLFVFTALILQFKVLKNFIISTIPFEKLILLALIGFTGFIIFVLLWIYSKWTFILFIKEKLAGLMEGMLSIVKMKKKWPFLFHSLFIWFTYILMFYVAIFALDETSTISLGAVITAFVIGSLAIGFTNSGFGAFPLLIAQIFLLYHIPETVGTAFGWLVWISQTALTVVLGSLSFLLLPLLNKNK
ncbi:YbhN family protein [Flavobacterium sp.]|uniref:YbhN family protein n=1 Tax=Flavobacterium sp. TaxID=239 RepID=UPI0037C10779